MWPHVYSDDGGSHSDDDGINLSGDGHVVCHNQLSGFGDALKLGDDGARADDFYGNEVAVVVRQRDRVRRERGQRARVPQPLHQHLRADQLPAGVRRAGLRAAQRRRERRRRADEVPRARHHAAAGAERRPRVPQHVRQPARARCRCRRRRRAITSSIENNLFVGPSSPAANVADWSGADRGRHDRLQRLVPERHASTSTPPASWSSFAAMKAAGVFEAHGVLLTAPRVRVGARSPGDLQDDDAAARRDARVGLERDRRRGSRSRT